MKILVTGASGFIGSNLIPFLKNKGHFVRGVGKSLRQERYQNLITYADEYMLLNLLDPNSAMIATRDIDFVIHMAADMGGVGYFSHAEYVPYLNNMQIDMNILRACEANRVKRLYYASSACAYNIDSQFVEGHAPKLREDLDLIPAHPDQLYGWQKLQTMLLCEKATFETCIGIQHTIFGEYQETEGVRMKFPTAIAAKVLQAKKDGKPIEIWGNGKQLRSFLYIEDALEKIYCVLMDGRYGDPVNIGSDQAVTVTEVAKMCCDIVGIEPNFVYTKDMPSGVLARNCDNTRFNTRYQYRDKYTTREGFAKLIKWLELRGAYE